MQSLKFYSLPLFSFLFAAFSIPSDDFQESHFDKIASDNFHNFYRLNDSVYRSEQPNKKGMRELEAMGIKSILNLRRQKTDEKKLKGLNLKVDRFPLKASELNFEDIFKVLQRMQKAEKPLLIHCWHGSDRTGAIVAASRMVFENWSNAQAIAEFTNEHFGYHQKRFPNLISLLETLDVDLLKKKLAEEKISHSQLE